MKLTKKQREKIIRGAINDIKTYKADFLCAALAVRLQIILDVNYNPKPRLIQKYIPEFKNTTAVKYFNARRKYCWWGFSDGRKNRLAFLNYLLTGKLPKKAKR